MTHQIYDKIIFNKIKQILGGKIRWFVSGGAPIPKDVMEFIIVAF